ncbi:nitrate reductase subunit alpha [Lactiplantibacillus plantarum]|nr:nitrate reductase subunit alpha [Lactiplantibacillus plantarum]
MKKSRFFKNVEKFNGTFTQLEENSRRWERLYRERWSHDKVVRTTHGVNCTGSCSWNVYVKQGIITWEHQATDYPECGVNMPGYEPRGCPRGLVFLGMNIVRFGSSILIFGANYGNYGRMPKKCTLIR